eukprot:7236631-Alexandrium_andersonii.AAC.1
MRYPLRQSPIAETATPRTQSVGVQAPTADALPLPAEPADAAVGDVEAVSYTHLTLPTICSV